MIFEQYGSDGFSRLRCFEEPAGVVEVRALEQVQAGLVQVEQAVAGGLYAAGFVTYEAAGGLDSHLVTHPAGPLPFLWFGLFRRMTCSGSPPVEPGEFSVGPWEPTLGWQDYRSALDRIHDYIAAGDTYQVNFTFPLRAKFAGDPRAFWRKLCRAQEARYGAYVDMGPQVICSASPELFFRLEAGQMVSQPMKGTAPRGLLLADDEHLGRTLAQSPKNRAENAMIVDMVRNDLGRIAQPGSVTVRDSFVVEKYPTVFQMVSTVEARLAEANRVGCAGHTAATPLPPREGVATPLPLQEGAGEGAVGDYFSRIMRAMFPPASITGAPKVRTMQIIRELEQTPRGVYTGCIGYLAPDGKAEFNVAIRTVVVDREAGKAEYGVGGGIVWDSIAEEEYRECATKSAVLTADRPEFELLETFLWEPGAGYFLLERHLHRLLESAAYFDFAVDRRAVLARLDEVATRLTGSGVPSDSSVSRRACAARKKAPAERVRVRLLVSRAGEIRLETAPLPQPDRPRPWRLGWAARPVDSRDVFLYHKTTNRMVYEQARRAVPACDDVILYNERGEITETTIANLVVEQGGERFTPPVTCGLLAGVFRAELLSKGEIREKVLSRVDVQTADAVYAINSVRRWMKAEMVLAR